MLLVEGVESAGGAIVAGICSKTAFILTFAEGMVNELFEIATLPFTTCHSLNLYPLFGVVDRLIFVPEAAVGRLAFAVPLPSL